MNKLTWSEALKHIQEFNRVHNITSQFQKKSPTCVLVIVFKPESFAKPYSEEQRSYAVLNSNKYFLPNMGGTSLYASCLDKTTDQNIRLDQYIHTDWKVDYCYILREDKS